ncbi:MAG: ATP-grasp domain-containing protein [Bdellovibrionaceae bacterium]|nr:ATP-grasp domain-containing protein [Bdellovibrionales bacterium]MCB9254938.1 ATP-grasp domain-containing protein [Pseudobdellovibrionaceae bacterium]
MKFCFVVGSLFQQKAHYTTTYLAYEAWRRGHDVAYASVEDFALGHGHKITALSAKAPPKTDWDRPTFLKALQDYNLRWVTQNLSEYDVLFLRFNPNVSPEIEEGVFAPALDLAHQLLDLGVRVINHPEGLRRSASKLYLSRFPENLHPRLFVSRRSEDLKDFLRELKKPAILKPLRGCGGKNVFLIRSAKEPNLNQILSTLTERGYVMAQEYVPGPKPGDKRILLFEGRIFARNGIPAIYRRVSPRGEIRSNMALGATAETTELTQEDLQIVEQLRPQLQRDGLDFVGVDIVGNKVIEINVFCPGGLGTLDRLYELDLTPSILNSIESRHRTEQSTLEIHQ